MLQRLFNNSISLLYTRSGFNSSIIFGGIMRYHSHSHITNLKRNKNSTSDFTKSSLNENLKFSDIKNISTQTVKSITEVFGFDRMTEVQSKVIEKTMKSDASDMVVQSRTGTGKTIAYLIPTIERLVQNPPEGIGAIIIAPTRELVLQITHDCEKLLSFHKMEVVALCGGHHRRQDQDMIRRKRPQLVVCTVGRLMDHLESTFMFHSLIENVQTLVLDEADRLLEVGRIQDLRAVLSYLPAASTGGMNNQGRQTLLFSATVNDAVKDIAARACRASFEVIDCVPKDEVVTAISVKQSAVIVPAANLTLSLYNIIMNEMQDRLHDYKIIVFFPTARLTAFMSSLFREQFRLPLQEIHRRRDGPSRLLASQRFANDQTSILFTSDVSARGMDYKNVSLVIQFCAPPDADQYVHRVGRTGRAGRDGSSILLLPSAEAFSVEELQQRKIPLETVDAEREGITLSSDTVVSALGSWRTKTQLIYQANAAFASLLTHFCLRGWRKRGVGDETDAVATSRGILLSTGMPDVPAISKRLSEELGLDGHPLLRIQEGLDDLQAVQAALRDRKFAAEKEFQILKENENMPGAAANARLRRLAALEAKVSARERTSERDGQVF